MADITPSFPLLIDSRQGSIDLAKHVHVPAEVTQLKFADVSFMGYGPDPDNAIWSIGIERKKIRDLIGSMESGRLSGHQLIGLLDFYHVVYILVEGVFRIRDGDIEIMTEKNRWVPAGGPRRQRVFSYREVANYLNTLTVIGNVHTWFTHNERVSGDWIRHTYYWWQKRWEEHKAHLKFHEPALPPKRARWTKPGLIQRVTKELKSVGWEIAGELEKVFPTMEELMRAEVKDLLKVPRVGKKTAESIWQELHRR